MKKRKYTLPAIIISLILSLFYYIQDNMQKPPTPENILSVHFLDVGQADSTLITSGSHAMLIDGGNRDDADYIIEYIENLGFENLDYVINTHGHEDHIGGLSEVIKTFDTNLVIAEDNYESSVCEDFFDTVKKYDISLKSPVVGKEYTLGDSVFRILGPIKDDYEDYNDFSISLRLEHGNNSFLFTGDSCYEGERGILSSGYNLKSDVLKAGHHGSSTSNSPSLLNAVSPAYSVISCGKDNSYGHPHKEVIQSFKSRNIEYFRTDTQGTIICESDGNEIFFYSEYNN